MGKVKGVFAYTNEEFFKKCAIIHNNKYDYSKSIYNGTVQNVTYTCYRHGEITQNAKVHSNGCGCPSCAKENAGMSLADFINKANVIHNYKYTYEKSIYINNRTPLIVTCPEHGDFEIRPANHLNGAGCKLCNLKKKSLA